MQRRSVGGRPFVLLTGFGPFPTVPRNATQWLVPHLAHQARRAFPDVHVEPVIVPTAWATAPVQIADMLTALEPDVALHFGVSGNAKGFELETRAFNATAAIADVTGAQAPPRPLLRQGPDLKMAQFPAQLIVSRLRQQGIPAMVSRDAGRYLCNAVLYHALHALHHDARAIRCGFVHVPSRLVASRGFGRDVALEEDYGTWIGALPPLPRSAPRVPLSWSQALAGGLITIAACLGRPAPRAMLLAQGLPISHSQHI